MVSFSLASCNSVPTRGGCPPLIQYSADTQKKAAKELRNLPKGSSLAQMIVDYKKTRDACRLGE
jgi:hypothetical protein